MYVKLYNKDLDDKDSNISQTQCDCILKLLQIDIAGSNFKRLFTDVNSILELIGAFSQPKHTEEEKQIVLLEEKLVTKYSKFNFKLNSATLSILSDWNTQGIEISLSENVAEFDSGDLTSFKFISKSIDILQWVYSISFKFKLNLELSII